LPYALCPLLLAPSSLFTPWSAFVFLFHRGSLLRKKHSEKQRPQGCPINQTDQKNQRNQILST
jgi:hypothetical protein